MEKKLLLSLLLGVLVGVVTSKMGFKPSDIMFWNILIPISLIGGLALKKI